jgi:hypothetical protein
MYLKSQLPIHILAYRLGTLPTSFLQLKCKCGRRQSFPFSLFPYLNATLHVGHGLHRRHLELVPICLISSPAGSRPTVGLSWMMLS